MAADEHHLDDGGFVGEVNLGRSKFVERYMLVMPLHRGVGCDIKIGVRVIMTIIHRNKSSTISPAKQQVRNNTQMYCVLIQVNRSSWFIFVEDKQIVSQNMPEASSLKSVNFR